MSAHYVTHLGIWGYYFICLTPEAQWGQLLYLCAVQINLKQSAFSTASFLQWPLGFFYRTVMSNSHLLVFAYSLTVNFTEVYLLIQNCQEICCVRSVCKVKLEDEVKSCSRKSLTTVLLGIWSVSSKWSCVAAAATCLLLISYGHCCNLFDGFPTFLGDLEWVHRHIKSTWCSAASLWGMVCHL